LIPHLKKKCAHSRDKSMKHIRAARPIRYRVKSKAGLPFNSKPADANPADQIYTVKLKVGSRSHNQLSH
jgi:hypothetical protein